MNAQERLKRQIRIAIIARDIYLRDYGADVVITAEIVAAVDKARRAEYYDRTDQDTDGRP